MGMHRDKSGAAAITGLFKVFVISSKDTRILMRDFQTLSMLKPKNLKVYGFCAFVRNSIGEESYVADEIITSRAKRRVRVGHTDAEGRMVMADLLCEAKELVFGVWRKDIGNYCCYISRLLPPLILLYSQLRL